MPLNDNHNEITKTVIEVTILHPSYMDVSDMTLHDIANHTNLGDFVAQRTQTISEELSEDKTAEELTSLGSAPGYFEAK